MLSKAKVIKGGKISIPSIYRKSLSIKEGDEIIFNLDHDRLTMIPVTKSLQEVRSMISKYHPNQSLVDKLIMERRAEAKNE